MTRSTDARPRSRFDVLLAATMLAFAVTSLLFDRAAALDLVAADSPDLFGRLLWQFGVAYDPLVAHNPLFLRVMSGVSAFGFGPFYLWGARALWRGDPRLRVPALVYASVMSYSMLVHVAVELHGELPPPDLLVFVLVYAPYCALPIALLARVGTPR
jgi:EXPERA (EXPanded EBP superfamily)